MVLGYSLLRAYVAEHIQLLLVFSTHTFFLSGCAVETREFSGSRTVVLRVQALIDGAMTADRSYHRCVP